MNENDDRGRDGANGHPMMPAEAIEGLLDLLVAERQRMREAGVPREPLEVNRTAIVYWQRELVNARRRALARV